MIHRAKFTNFKCLADVELDRLGNFATFVGPNGSGKTSVLEALHYVSKLGTRKPSEFFDEQREAATLLRRGASNSQIGIEIEGDWSGTKGVVHLCVQVSRSSENGEDREPRFELGANFDDGTQRQPLDKPLVYAPKTRDFGFAVESAVLLRLNPEELAAPSYSETEQPRIKYDGEGLATVLREMQANRPDAFSDLIESLKAVVPAVEGVRTRRAPVWKTSTRKITVDGESFTGEETEKFMGEEVVFDMEGASDLPAHAVSEGTLLVLGLLAVLMNERRPNLVLLDDIEQSLHPKALEDLIGTLRKLLEKYSDLQILATSHSPYLLDHLDADEVWLTNLDDDGSTVARRLSEHPDYEEWADEMSPGEFWSYVGENWVTGTDD